MPSPSASDLDAPGHVVWVETREPVGVADVAFGPSLRTDLGDAVFSVERTVQLDLAYMPPAANGCESAE